MRRTVLSERGETSASPSYGFGRSTLVWGGFAVGYRKVPTVPTCWRCLGLRDL